MGNEFVEVEKFDFLGNCFKLIEKYTVLDCIDLPYSNENFENMRCNYYLSFLILQAVFHFQSAG